MRGADISCQVSDHPINPGEILDFISDLGHGAQTIFLGSVRSSNQGREVIAVAYDAFEPLAERALHEIALEAIARWGELRICVRHRVGELRVGEASVGIGVTSRHRDEAYKASRYIIEQLKQRVPIWKKEIYSDGETQWLKGHALCSHPRGAHAE